MNTNFDLNINYINEQKSYYIGIPCIYFLIKDDVIVYVGQSKKGEQRVFQHTNKDFDSYYIRHCHQYELNDLEAFYIAKFNPKYNNELPQNDLFKTIEQLKKILNLNKREIKKIIRKKEIPCYLNNYYFIYDFIRDKEECKEYALGEHHE